MGTDQYVCSVDDEKTSAPAEQGEIQPELAAPSLGQLHATALCCPRDLHKKMQRCHPVGLPHVPGDVLMAGGDKVSCSKFFPGLSILHNAL